MGIFSRFVGKPDTLYYPGCFAYFRHKDKFGLYKRIFSKLGIDFVCSENIICCGLPAFETGYESEARKLARKKFELLQENGIKKIITNCPDCHKMFSKDYPEFLPDWNIEVVNIWKVILEKIAKKPRLIKTLAEESITYHDSCYLGRQCGIYDEPRKILELLGYRIEEMADSRENSVCAGSCGSLSFLNPGLADNIARQRLLQVKRKGVKKVVVASMKNYDLLRKNAEEMDIEVLELSEIIAKALNIKIPEKKKEEGAWEIREEMIEINENLENEEEGGD